MESSLLKQILPSHLTRYNVVFRTRKVNILILISGYLGSIKLNSKTWARSKTVGLNVANPASPYCLA